MSTQPHTEKTRKRVLERLATDPHFFVSVLFDEMGWATKAPLGDIEHDFIDHVFNGPRLRGALSFRGFGKTTIAAACLTLYRGFRDPARQIIIPSKSLDAPKRTVAVIREAIDRVWFLQHMSPSRNKDLRDAATYFDFGHIPHMEKQPSVVAIGIEGQLEGNRAHTIIPDDCETKNNSKTAEGRAELRRLFSEFINILYPYRPHDAGGPVDPSEIVVIGTPKCVDSLYVKISDDRHELPVDGGPAKPTNFKVYSWPIAAPPPGLRVINLAPSIASKLEAGTLKPWEPTCPHRFGRDEIAIRMAEGKEEFEREHMLVAETSEDSKRPLRLSDIIVFDVHRDNAPRSIMYGRKDHNGSTAIQMETLGIGDDCFYYAADFSREWVPYQGTKMRIDPAGKGEDEFAWAIASHANGMFYVKSVGGLMGGPSPENLATIADEARNHRVNEIIVEGNSGWGLVADLIQPILRRTFIKPGDDPSAPEGWACSVSTVHSSANKFTRICNTLEQVFMQHRVVFDRRVAADTTLQYQMTRITRQAGSIAKDDRVDALSGVIADWQSMASIDPAHAAKTVSEDRIRRAIEEAAREDGEAGAEPRPRTWACRDRLAV